MRLFVSELAQTKYSIPAALYKICRTYYSFQVVVVQRRAKKCTKIYNAQRLFYSLTFLFNGIVVVVAVVVCLSSLRLSNIQERVLATYDSIQKQKI